MRTMSLPITNTVLAVFAALGLTLVGTACSGGDGVGEAGVDAREVQATDRTVTTEGADAVAARLATAEFDVDGMTCGGCVLATEMAVKKLEGVKSADAEYDEATDKGRCTVEYDPSAVGTGEIAAAIEKAGFTPTLKGADETG